MTIIVTDTGFAPDQAGLTWVEVQADTDLTTLAADLPQIAAIRISFASFADGRGFTLAARLRRMGFAGKLRARGHVIADQYAMARRAGFDEVEIDNTLATRQPEAQWRARADWQEHDYRARFRVG